MAQSASSTQTKLEEVMRAQLPVKHLIIIDFSGGCEGSKLDLYICSDRFTGLKLLDRHRLVNDAVTAAGLFSHIHALTIKAWTEEEWEKRSSSIPQQMQQAQANATSPH